MSLIHEHNDLQQVIKAAQERMAVIEAEPEFATEKEFETKLRSLLAEYHRSLRDIITIIDPNSRRPSEFQVAQPKPRKERQLITYKNPHDGSIVETKGGNNKILKEWYAEYGKDVVKGWASTN